MNSDIDVALIYEDTVPSELVDEFQQTVAADGLKLHVESRQKVEYYAALTWLLPTAIMAYIAKPYFESFLSEMGKDHYSLLKKGLKRLWEVCGHAKATIIGSKGKVANDQPYSLVYSIWFDRNSEGQCKFLVPVTLSPDEEAAAMEAFFSFLEAYYTNSLPDDLIASVDTPNPLGGRVLVAYNPASNQIEVIDPAPRR